MFSFGLHSCLSKQISEQLSPAVHLYMPTAEGHEDLGGYSALMTDILDAASSVAVSAKISVFPN
jgi:hypothetical protein